MNVHSLSTVRTYKERVGIEQYFLKIKLHEIFGYIQTIV